MQWFKVGGWQIFGSYKWVGSATLCIFLSINILVLLLFQQKHYRQKTPVNQFSLNWPHWGDSVIESVCGSAPSGAVFFRPLIGPQFTRSVQTLSLVLPPPSPQFFLFLIIIFFWIPFIIIFFLTLKKKQKNHFFNSQKKFTITPQKKNSDPLQKKITGKQKKLTSLPNISLNLFF